MRRTLPSDGDSSRPDRGRKALVRRRSRLAVRWNSIAALACSREACFAATIRLCCMYRLSLDEPSLPVIDLMLKRASSLSRSKLLNCLTLDPEHSSLIDLPIRHARVRGANLWKFDVFSLKRQSSDQLVSNLGMHLFEVHDLFRRLQLNQMVVLRALNALESVYWKHNPYHTAVHAADVMQALHCFISQPKLLRLLSPVEILGSLLAAACHDADHPGMNQMYLERTNNFLVNLYNCTSVLEQHHARCGLSILHQSGLIGELSAQDWNRMRGCIVQMVHATDMAYQGFYRDKFTEMVNANRNQNPQSYTPEDRILLLQITLKCADISNPCRPWEACRQWAHRICSEFFGQGDHERFRWSLAPTIGCDRNAASVPRIQMAFIDNLIRPLFTKWHEFFQSSLTHELMRNMENNYLSWKQELIAREFTAAAETSPPPRPKSKITNAISEASNPGRKTQRKGLKSKLAIGKKKTDNKTAKPQTHSVTFQIEAPTQGKCDFQQGSAELDSSLKSGFQTFFITTRGIRRHSLPETQGAIKKTFDFALFKRSSTHTESPPTVEGARETDMITSLPNVPKLHFFHVNKSTIKSLRTASGNIMQTLCEEIISQEPKSDHSRAFDLVPFPLPEAWNTAVGSPLSSNAVEQSNVHLTGLTIRLSVSDFISLAHRRSSVPLIEK